MTDNAFKARDIGLRAQKKILSRMATKNIVKTFIDGTTASLLDNVYRLAKLHVCRTTKNRPLGIGTATQFFLQTYFRLLSHTERQQERSRTFGQKHHQDRHQNRCAASQQSVQRRGDEGGRSIPTQVSGKRERNAFITNKQTHRHSHSSPLLLHITHRPPKWRWSRSTRSTSASTCRTCKDHWPNRMRRCARSCSGISPRNRWRVSMRCLRSSAVPHCWRRPSVRAHRTPRWWRKLSPTWTRQWTAVICKKNGLLLLLYFLHDSLHCCVWVAWWCSACVYFVLYIVVLFRYIFVGDKWGYIFDIYVNVSIYTHAEKIHLRVIY